MGQCLKASFLLSILLLPLMILGDLEPHGGTWRALAPPDGYVIHPTTVGPDDADPALGIVLDAKHISRDDVAETQGPTELVCPSANVITARYRCKQENIWTDCVRTSCCPNHTFVMGRCVPNHVDPCSLGVCEQQCAVYFGRVVCTCHAGYKFDPELHRRAAAAAASHPDSDLKSCVDVDECSRDDNAGCQQVCTNQPGSYLCGCQDGYQLGRDNHTCQAGPTSAAAFRSSASSTHVAGTSEEDLLKSSKNLDYVHGNLARLQVSLDDLTVKMRSISTAIRLFSFAGGIPGPEGPPGPPGPPGPRGFPGSAFSGPPGTVAGTPPSDLDVPDAAEGAEDHEDGEVEDVEGYYDSYKMVKGSRKSGGKKFCRCKRGPIGRPGAPGPEGPRGVRGERGPAGPKGDPGYLDLMMLMISDLRKEIEELRVLVQSKEPPSSPPAKVDRNKAHSNAPNAALQADRSPESKVAPAENTMDGEPEWS